MNVWGESCVDRAIDRIRLMEPSEGYILCQSGGKDSTVLEQIAVEAGVSFESHHHVTTIDPPEVIRYLRKNYPDTIFDKPHHGMSFAQRVGLKGYPTRRTRWCCDEFKERSHGGRVLLMGLRAAEKRQSGRVHMTRICYRTGERAVNPLFDWTDYEIWSFIESRDLPYCALYDEGWDRVGCVCCPFASVEERLRSWQRWPGMFRAIFRGFQKRWETHWIHTDYIYRCHGPAELFTNWMLGKGVPRREWKALLRSRND